MLNTNRWPQYGEEGLNIAGIVLHNSGDLTKSARDWFNYYNDESVEHESTHFIIDADEIIECMPTSWKTWSTGKGNDWAFDNCIVVTVCNETTAERYLIAQKKAIELIKELLIQNNLTLKDLYFHIEFNKRIYCPSIVLNKYGTKEKFIEEEF